MVSNMLINKSQKYSRIKNKLVISIFFLTSYISFRVSDMGAIDWFLGICFLLAGVYGLICYDEKLRYLF